MKGKKTAEIATISTDIAGAASSSQPRHLRHFLHYRVILTAITLIGGILRTDGSLFGHGKQKRRMLVLTVR